MAIYTIDNLSENRSRVLAGGFEYKHTTRKKRNPSLGARINSVGRTNLAFVVSVNLAMFWSGSVLF